MGTHTPVCDLLGIQYPIVEAPLAADPRLPAAVSNAGALGSLGLSWAEDAGQVVRETAALTDRPVAANFVLTSDQHRRVEQALSAGVRIVSFIWGDPKNYVQSVHDAGGVVMHTVGSAEEARRAVECGVDVIVAQGWEAGGHVWGGVATLPLVPVVVDAVAPAPVVAAGGIGDARGVAAVLALGAQAAMLGTRFLLADEMPIHEEYRRRLIAAAETDAEWYANLYEVGWPDSPHRAIHNSTAEDVGGRGRPAPGSRPREGEQSRSSLRAKRSFDIPQRLRWSERPVRSKRCRCGPDRASRSQDNATGSGDRRRANLAPVALPARNRARDHFRTNHGGVRWPNPHRRQRELCWPTSSSQTMSSAPGASTPRTGGKVVFSGGPTYVALSNSWIIINSGGGPTDDKPAVTLQTPRDPNRVSSFLNIRVRDIEAVYAEWSARGAHFLTPPKHHQYEIRCYIRDPDGHLIEVGQTTDPDGDWSPAHWPSSAPADEHA